MTIKQWLDDPNRSYADGLSLYQKVKITREYDSFFADAVDPQPGSVHFNILISQLQRAQRKINDRGEAQAAIKKAPGASKAIADDAAKEAVKQKKQTLYVDLPELENINDLPEEVKAAYIANKKLMPELAGARQELAAAKTDQERKVLAERVSEIDQERHRNWKIVDDFRKGLKKDAGNPPADDPVQEALKLKRRIETLKINIARAVKELESGKLTGKKLENRRASLASWEEELAGIESKPQA